MDISELPSLSRSEYNELLKLSDNIFEFWIGLSTRLLGYEEGQLYGEKTPCNSIHFLDAMALNPNLYGIHIYRNPYDTIASLINRGKSPMQALALYMYNTANGLRAKDSVNYIGLSYETLVNDPEKEVTRILDNLGLIFTEELLIPNNNSSAVVTKLESWKYDETEKVQSGSVNRFHKLKDSTKEIIMALMQNVCLTSPVCSSNSIQKICKELNYDFLEAQSLNVEEARRQFKLHKASFRFSRRKFQGHKYPLSFEEN